MAMPAFAQGRSARLAQDAERFLARARRRAAVIVSARRLIDGVAARHGLAWPSASSTGGLHVTREQLAALASDPDGEHLARHAGDPFDAVSASATAPTRRGWCGGLPGITGRGSPWR